MNSDILLTEPTADRGCDVVGHSATLAPYDVVDIVEAPDNDTMLAMSATLGRMNGASGTSRRAF